MTRLTSVHRISGGSGRPVQGDNEFGEVDSYYGGPGSGHHGHSGRLGKTGGSMQGISKTGVPSDETRKLLKHSDKILKNRDQYPKASVDWAKRVAKIGSKLGISW